MQHTPTLTATPAHSIGSCGTHPVSSTRSPPNHRALQMPALAGWLTGSLVFFLRQKHPKPRAINSQAPKRFFYFFRERRRGRVGCVRVRRSAKPNSALCRRATLKNLIYWRYATVFSTERLVPSTEALLDCFLLACSSCFVPAKVWSDVHPWLITSVYQKQPHATAVSNINLALELGRVKSNITPAYSTFV